MHEHIIPLTELHCKAVWAEQAHRASILVRFTLAQTIPRSVSSEVLLHVLAVLLLLLYNRSIDI
jgi:hypothetical protein